MRIGMAYSETNDHEYRLFWRFFWVLLLIAGICLVWVFLPAVPLSGLAQVKPGMPRAEVEKRLGKRSWSNDEKDWGYERPFALGYIYVVFDDNNQVRYVDHEWFKRSGRLK
jgi:hypothetical protein